MCRSSMKNKNISIRSNVLIVHTELHFVKGSNVDTLDLEQKNIIIYFLKQYWFISFNCDSCL